MAEWATFLLAAFGACLGLYQYWQNSKQTTAIRAADEMERFGSDEKVAVAEHLIDYSPSFILYKDSSGNIQETIVGPMDFHLALRHHSVGRHEVPGYDRDKDIFANKKDLSEQACKNLYSGREMYIRDVFDRFLARLERIEALISKGVISADDFADHFSYWIKLIGDNSDQKNLTQFSAERRETLLKYIKRYEFNGVIRLFARYGRDMSPP
jgi:hypothetical protein